MLKATFISLTLLLGVYSAQSPEFNTFFAQPEFTNAFCPHHQQAFGACHRFHTAQQDRPFGAEMGKFIRTQVRESNYRIRTVVIDAGHGGHDSGCSGTNTREKYIALNIALKLGAALSYQFPDVQVLYTRKTDVFVPLHKRAAIANENKADLFISIHCNAIPNADYVKGSETYVMGLHRAKENLDVAKRENAAILLEENYQHNYQGYDPNSPEGHIILSMYQNASLEQSILLAHKIENQIQYHAQRRSRGVKQAGFLVLRQTTMPSVLVEAGYLTNSQDNRYLATDYGQTKIATSILRAFREYKQEVEQAPVPGYRPERKLTVSEPIITRKAPVEVRSKGIPQSYIIADKPPQAASSADETIAYKVMMLSSEQLINTKKGKWKQVAFSIEVKEEEGSYKYLAFGFDSFDEALKAKNKLRQQGFKEAFVVAYQGSERLSVAEARNRSRR
ncbi:MAG: N-acetylmuramoyl-L-alanine amidase [Bacteroidota bacterium]